MCLGGRGVEERGRGDKGKGREREREGEGEGDDCTIVIHELQVAINAYMANLPESNQKAFV